MSVLNKAEKEFARDLLFGVQKILKGPGKRYWVELHHRLDQKTGSMVETVKMPVGGDRYWSPAFMYYDPHGPRLVIATVIASRDVELVRIDLNYPRSLVRAYLREQIKRAIERYAEETRLAAERRQ